MGVRRDAVGAVTSEELVPVPAEERRLAAENRDSYLAGWLAGVEAFGRAQRLQDSGATDVEVLAAGEEVERDHAQAERRARSNLPTPAPRWEGQGFVDGYAFARRGLAQVYRDVPWLGELPGLPAARATREQRPR